MNTFISNVTFGTIVAEFSCRLELISPFCKWNIQINCDSPIVCGSSNYIYVVSDDSVNYLFRKYCPQGNIHSVHFNISLNLSYGKQNIIKFDYLPITLRKLSLLNMYTRPKPSWDVFMSGTPSFQCLRRLKYLSILELSASSIDNFKRYIDCFDDNLKLFKFKIRMPVPYNDEVIISSIKDKFGYNMNIINEHHVDDDVILTLENMENLDTFYTMRVQYMIKQQHCIYLKPYVRVPKLLLY